MQVSAITFVALLLQSLLLCPATSFNNNPGKSQAATKAAMSDESAATGLWYVNVAVPSLLPASTIYSFSARPW